MTPYIDAHTHVQFSAFKDDWRETIDRALEAGVYIVNVGTQRDTSAQAVEIAREYEEGVYAVVGLHPVHTGKSFHDAAELGDTTGAKGFTSRGEKFDYEHYRSLALAEKVVAIGECGFDFFRLEGDVEEVRRAQREALEAQIALAADVKKPLMIHCRSGKEHDAFHDLIEALKTKTQNLTPGVVHFFSGTKEDAKELLDMGYSFTFGGVITFVHDYDEVVRAIPTERILSETDAPYVTPAPHRGKRNEPFYVIEVVRRLAELKDVSEEEMKEKIWENAKRIFGIHV